MGHSKATASNSSSSPIPDVWQFIHPRLESISNERRGPIIIIIMFLLMYDNFLCPIHDDPWLGVGTACVRIKHYQSP